MSIFKFLLIVCGITFLSSCTQAFYLTNNSNQSQVVKVAYDKCIPIEDRNSDLKPFQKKGLIRDITYTSNGSSCIFQFTLEAKRQLPLVTILRESDALNNQNEKRILVLSKYSEAEFKNIDDKIIVKIGPKIIQNKFRLTSHFFSALGKTNFVYEIN